MSLTPPIEAPPDPPPEDSGDDHPDPGPPPGAPDPVPDPAPGSVPDPAPADPPPEDAPADPPPGDDPAARQLSLFGVEALEPGPADLAGLLAGPGQVVRMGGTARVSVVVDAAWRVHVLVAELARRGLTASWVATGDGQHGVRTSYATTLAPLGAAWLPGAVKRPPAGFHLNGPRLRLWAAAAGTVEPLGYLLRLGADEEGCWAAVGGALAGIGLSGVLLGPRSGGPAYRITGRRRLARLAELVGERPSAAPPAEWPGVAYRHAGGSGGQRGTPRRSGPTGYAEAARQRLPAAAAAADGRLPIGPEAVGEPLPIGLAAADGPLPIDPAVAGAGPAEGADAEGSTE